MSVYSNALRGKVALVTGASRGIGKGIALELGAAGATVYITARTIERQAGSLPGTAPQTAEEVTKLGGNGIAIQCDHKNDDQVAGVVHEIERREGQLDILVNNVYDNVLNAVGPHRGGRPFWQVPLSAWDDTISIGLRSHFVATSLAMPLLIKGGGLVVSISSCGAYRYFHSVHYGVQKAGVDRMMRDMAFELGDLPVTFVALWPGFVRTEFVETMVGYDCVKAALEMAQRIGREVGKELTAEQIAAARLESPRFPGKAVVALAADPNVRKKTGRSLSAAGIAAEYGYTDAEGNIPDAFCFRNTDIWQPLAIGGRIHNGWA
jgi:dehydrogenase/reductase SDR family member 1